MSTSPNLLLSHLPRYPPPPKTVSSHARRPPRVPLCCLSQESLCIGGRLYLLGLEPQQKLTVLGNYINSSAARSSEVASPHTCTCLYGELTCFPGYDV